MSVIVTNANSAKALVVTRSLGRKGIDVITTDNIRRSPTFFSKYSTDHFISPSAEKTQMDFVSELLRQVKKRRVEVLMPVNSTETLLVSKFKDKFTPFTNVPFHDYSKMMLLHDKEKLMKIAPELGISIPKSFIIKDISDIRNIAGYLEFPQVIKLRNATSSVGISYAYSESDFIEKYKQTIMKYNLNPDEYPLIQEYIPGDSYGVSALFNHGDLRAIFVHKRLREYPITGGPSTLRISVRHPEMETIAIKLLKNFDWHGIAMVEFKLDKRNNRPILIEVNPRFWGSINQAVASGVDFPYLLYKMALEGDIEPVLNYKLGVKTRFLLNDFRAFPDYFKISNNRFQLVKEFFKFYDKNLYYDTISCDDILPGIMFINTGINKLFNSKYK